jgi:hypothetical protein
VAEKTSGLINNDSLHPLFSSTISKGEGNSYGDIFKGEQKDYNDQGHIQAQTKIRGGLKHCIDLSTKPKEESLIATC